MKVQKEFTIPFSGLKLGEHRFDFTIEKSFFEYFEYDEFNEVDIRLDVLFIKKNTLLEITLTFNGIVNVLCDISNEPYNQSIDGEFHFVVKFGDTFNDDNEELLILPHGSYEVSIQQYVYESIVLAMPARRIHPGVEDGSLQSDILLKLEELSLKRKEEDNLPDENDKTDPRWDSLKKLLTDK